MERYKHSIIGMKQDDDGEFVKESDSNQYILQMEDHFKNKFISEFAFDVKVFNDRKEQLKKDIDLLDKRQIQFSKVEKSFYDMKNKGIDGSLDGVIESMADYINCLGSNQKSHFLYSLDIDT